MFINMPCVLRYIFYHVRSRSEVGAWVNNYINAVGPVEQPTRLIDTVG